MLYVGSPTGPREALSGDTDGQDCISTIVEDPRDTHVLCDDRTVYCEDIGELSVPASDDNGSVSWLLVGKCRFYGVIRHRIRRNAGMLKHI
jgi:hypothetical protein